MEENLTISASRVPPPRVKAVCFEGKRYEQNGNGHLQNLPQRTGYMAIFAEANNEKIGVVKIYDVELIPDLEEDVQDVFFTRLELVLPQREIHIQNERRQVFAYSVDTGTVREVTAAPAIGISSDGIWPSIDQLSRE